MYGEYSNYNQVHGMDARINLSLASNNYIKIVAHRPIQFFIKETGKNKVLLYFSGSKRLIAKIK